MKRRNLLVVMALILLVMSSLSVIVWAQGEVELYSGTWRSGIGILNLTNSSNTIEVKFYNADTGEALPYTYSESLGEQSGIEIYLPNLSDSDLPAGSYAAVVSSEYEVGVTVTSTDYDYNIADSYNGVDASTEFFVPGIYNNHNNWTSEILVQNTNENTINVNLEFSGKSLYTGDPVNPDPIGPFPIPGHATRSFDTGLESPVDFDTLLGDGFVGSVKVTNTENKDMAVLLYDTRVIGSQQVMLSYRGLTDQDAGVFLAAPVLYKNFHSGWASGIKVQNVDTSDPVDAKITVTSQDGSFSATSTETIAPGKFYEWYLPSATFDGGVTIPDGFIGSATVEVVDTGTGKIVGTATSTNYTRAKGLDTSPSGEGVALAYIMPSRNSGAATLSAPTVYKKFGTGEWNSSLVVSNVGTDPVNFELKFANDAGYPAFNETISGFSLNAGEAHEIYLPNSINGNTVPDGFKGSILVTATSTSGTPKIAGIIQHVNYGRGTATVSLAPTN